MSTRAIIQVSDAAAAAGRLPSRVKALFDAHGVTDVRASHPELRGVYVAVLPDDVEAAGVLRQLKSLPDIRHAELEQFRSDT